jgi:hypothetical protein
MIFVKKNGLVCFGAKVRCAFIPFASFFFWFFLSTRLALLQLVLSVGGGEGGGSATARRALLLLDASARTAVGVPAGRLLLAARGLSGGLTLQADPGPGDAIGGDVKVQTGDVDTVSAAPLK